MADVMNEVGFTHVCLGNHEFDLSLDDLKLRLNQMKHVGKILSTNVIFPNGETEAYNCVQYDITTLEPHGLKIGWIGLLTKDTVDLLKAGGLYEKYQGLAINDPIDTLRKMEAKMKSEGVDIIIPLTHLLVNTDRKLAEECSEHGIKLIMGGHDHDKYHEHPNGVTIVKSGYDAIDATIATIHVKLDDIKKNKENLVPYDVKTEIVNVSGVTTDAKKYARMLEICREGEEKLAALGSTVLIPPSPEGEEVLSSKDPRNKQCTVGRMLCDMLKAYFKADVGLITGGKIRNKSDYPKGLTVTDIGAELPFKDNFTYMVTMTAAEIEDTIKFSWTEKKGQGGFLQYDNDTIFDQKANILTHVAGTELDRATASDKLFKVVMPISILNGMDGLEPLVAVGKRHNTKAVSLDHLMLMQNIITKVCVLRQWERLNMSCRDFALADINKDLKLQRHEFVSYMQKVHPGISRGIIDLFWDALDDDRNGSLSPSEFLRRSSHRMSQYALLAEDEDLAALENKSTSAGGIPGDGASGGSVVARCSICTVA
uniref:EF-hand domain-containing protein n=1 Tax=Lotharella globosa TaxID=91324 RepID=A0A7S3ZAI4_9EUKA